MEVRESTVLGPDGSIVYTVTEDFIPECIENKYLREHEDGFSKDRSMRRIARIPQREYVKWNSRYPGCWSDDSFLRSWMLENEENCTVKRGTF